ncbi:MAG: HAMP domain-containing histidine kinase [Tagaea sp.]|nr:HAMP domain-containing histidine kinase [Tagaea sp.]
MSARLPRVKLAWKVPLVVACLMIVVAAGISKTVLDRLDHTQARHVEQLTGAYLDGLSTALQPALLRRDAWEAFDALDRARRLYSGVRTLDVLAILPDGNVLAAADPLAHPVLSAAPAEAARPPRAPPPLEAADGRAWIHREMSDDGVKIGRIAALIDVSAYLAERREAQTALIVFNAALTLALAGLGYVFVRRMLAPATLLSDAFAAAADGEPKPISPVRMPAPESEGGKLLRGYNRMVEALAERETLRKRLAEEERAALLGKLASSLAHEVNNPLGGMFNALAMIRRHGGDAGRRENAAALIERGLASIRDIVRASLVQWRSGEAGRALTRTDLDDLRFLAQAETRARGLRLDWRGELDGDEAPVSAQHVRQVALNLVLNACAASPRGGTVTVRALAAESRVILTVDDSGAGMPESQRARLLDAGEAAPGAGLGLWTVARLVRAARGAVSVEDAPGGGTRVRAIFPFAGGEDEDARTAA